MIIILAAGVKFLFFASKSFAAREIHSILFTINSEKFNNSTLKTSVMPAFQMIFKNIFIICTSNQYENESSFVKCDISLFLYVLKIKFRIETEKRLQS